MKGNYIGYKGILRGILSVTMAVGATLSAMAVPARRGILQVDQPDGSTLEVRLQGDEWGHLYTTEDGYPLLFDDNVGYVYAGTKADGTLISSGIRARNMAERRTADREFLKTVNKDNIAPLQKSIRRKSTRGVGLFPDSKFPVKGEQKVLVILVEFQDVAFNSKNRQAYDYSTIAEGYTAHDYFSELLNLEGFSHFRGTGSCRDWFLFNSRDAEGNPQFMPTFDVFGPVTLPNNMKYYGGNDWSGNDKNAEGMVIDACNALDDVIDFSEYDRNHDGYVDNVYIFYAGYGEADGGGNDTVWPHSWNLSEAGKTLELDGVKIDRYGCSNETDRQTGRPDGIGTFTHEFSHVMGLPDLYSTTYANVFSMGEFSVMDYGSYNNNGRTPPNYSSFERAALDWLTPKTFDMGEGDYVLPPMADTNTAYMVPCLDKEGYLKPNEYFLCEARPQTGNDRYIPGHGMLIWHIDYNENVWLANAVNNISSHQYVDLIEANGVLIDSARRGHPFPGVDNITDYTFAGWSGTACGVSFSDIEEIEDSSDSSDTPVTPGSIRMHVVKDLEPEEKPQQDPDISGIDSIIGDGEVTGIYNLQGVRLTEPPAHGPYILRTTQGTYKLRNE